MHATLMTLDAALRPVMPQMGEETMTFGDFLMAGGPWMVPIIVCSVFVVAFTFERFVALTRGRVCPNSIDEPLSAVERGDMKGAEELLQKPGSPAHRILAAGVRRRGFQVRDVESAMEDQGRKEGERMLRNIRPLSLIAGVAPLLGLLGTVVGIAESFRVVSDQGMGKPEELASGIEVALTTTIAGLVVAIPALLIASHLQSKVRNLMARTDDKLAPAVELLAQRPRVLDGEGNENAA